VQERYRRWHRWLYACVSQLPPCLRVDRPTSQRANVECNVACLCIGEAVAATSHKLPSDALVAMPCRGVRQRRFQRRHTHKRRGCGTLDGS